MKPKEFIIGELEKIVKDFPFVQLKYRFDTFCESHYVEVMPVNYYLDCETLNDRLFEIVDYIIDNYDNESIVFLTEGDLIKMGDAEEIVTGNLFNKPVEASWAAFSNSLKKMQINIDNDLVKDQGANQFALAA